MKMQIWWSRLEFLGLPEPGTAKWRNHMKEKEEDGPEDEDSGDRMGNEGW